MKLRERKCERRYNVFFHYLFT